MYGLLLRIKE